MKMFSLTPSAESDLSEIWKYTYRTWGLVQADHYFDQIEACCDAIGRGEAIGKPLAGLPDGVRLFRCRHHFLIYLTRQTPTIIAVLHERMNLLDRVKDRL